MKGEGESERGSESESERKVWRKMNGIVINLIKVWMYGEDKAVATLKGHRAGVQSVVVDGKHIISASDDYNIKVFKRKKKKRGAIEGLPLFLSSPLPLPLLVFLFLILLQVWKWTKL